MTLIFDCFFLHMFSIFFVQIEQTFVQITNLNFMRTILNYQNVIQSIQNSMSHQSWSLLSIGVCRFRSISPLKYFGPILGSFSFLTGVLGYVAGMSLKLN